MTKKRNFNLNLAVLATGIMAFTGVLIETAMNVTFPTLLNQFHIETNQVQWVTTIYLLMIAIIVPLSSYLIKNYSMRNLFLCAICLFLVGVALDSVPINFSLLLLGRMLQGAATGIALPLMFNIILTKAPLERRGFMIGIGTLTTSIAPAIGPTYGGMLTSTVGWQYIYVLLLPVLILTALIGMYAIPKEPIVKSGHLNLLAAGALAVLFSSMLLSFSLFGKPIFWIVLVLVGVSAISFVKLNKKEPLINLALFKNRQFSIYLFGFVIFQAMLLGISFIIPNFMQLTLGITSSKAGLMMFPGALVGAIFAPLSGRLLDKIGEKKPILLGFSISIIGWLFLTIFLTSGLITLIVTSHVIFMVGVGLAYSNLMAMGLSSILSYQNADGNAIFTTLQQFSGAISTAFVALAMSIFQQNTASFIEGTSTGALAGLYFFLVLLLIGFLVVFRALKNCNTADCKTNLDK